MTKGTHALTYPILRELGDDTPMTFLIAEWHQTYDCLIGQKVLRNLEANIDYKNQLFSTAKFEINYLSNIPEGCKTGNVNHHRAKTKAQIRTDHMNNEEKQKIEMLCNKYNDCFYYEEEKLSATNAVSHNIPTKDDHPVYVKSFRYPYHLKETIQEQIRKLLKDEIIRPSNSPYSSPVWIVPEKEDASGKRNGKWS